MCRKESRELIAEQVGQSRNQISRYIRLTELIPEILEMVDNRKMASVVPRECFLLRAFDRLVS